MSFVHVASQRFSLTPHLCNLSKYRCTNSISIVMVSNVASSVKKLVCLWTSGGHIRVGAVEEPGVE